jgi:tetratricopeptide (TPR) repeat protein/DNA-binding CsgD family transcriptional regulator
MNYKHLKIINGVNFTPREIDVIACLLSGKGSKTIAQFLSIEEKTVETHKYNVLRKLECNTKEGIIHFVEKSDKFSALKNHYVSLLCDAIFEKYLKQILGLKKSDEVFCVLIYEKTYSDIDFVNQLLKHLKLAGIKTCGELKGDHKSLNHLIHHVNSQAVNSLIYLTSETFLTKLKVGDPQTKLEVEALTKKMDQNNRKTLFVLQSDEALPAIPQEIKAVGYIDIGAQGNYYYCVLEILQSILSNVSLENLIADFKKHYETINGDGEKTPSQLWSEIEGVSETKKPKNHFLTFHSKRKSRGLYVGGTLVAGCACLLLVLSTNNSFLKSKDQHNNTQDPGTIRSELLIPADKTLLTRPRQLAQIEESLKGKEGIQTVALVGVGGAGKTTIARQYGKSQKSNDVWEINAETQENLKDSFDNLAQTLAKTDEDRKILQLLREIKNTSEREESILQYVQQRLRLRANWLLIYDNVERYADIKKFFPYDADLWGRGSVIVTTRDTNIQNNNHISHVIHIGELDPKEKLVLFRGIMSNGNPHQIYLSQQKQAQIFIDKLPPYPLDISTASYYIKTTNVSYEDYLRYLSEYDKDFESIQEDLLSEASKYTKTRYSIIRLSLQHIIKSNSEFKELLFLISLLDSQKIPRDLLRKYKNDILVDNFIYHLKKHSLIIDESFTPLGLTISIHRSTQGILLSLLKKSINEEEKKKFLLLMTKVIESYTADIMDNEDFSKMKLLTSHYEKFMSHQELLAHCTVASIGGRLGSIYYYQGSYLKAKGMLESSQSLIKQDSEKDSQTKAYTLMFLGNVYRGIGDYKKSRELLNKSINIYRRNSTNSSGLARALGYLCYICRETGCYKEAEKLLNQSLEIYRNSTNGDSIPLAWILAHLGMTYRETGNYDKAKTNLEQSLTIYRTKSEDYVGVAWALGHLGIVYKEIGNHQKSQELLEASIRIYKKHFSENHIYVNWALAHLAEVFCNLKQYEKAKTTLEKSLAVHENNHGINHISTAQILNSLGKVNFLEGNIERAELLLNRALAIYQEHKHPESYRALENLSELYTRRFENIGYTNKNPEHQTYKNKALIYLQQALSTVKSHFPSDSPHAIRIRAKLSKLEKI